MSRANGHSADDIESTPEPIGAKQTDPDPRLTWRIERARLGGYEQPVAFTELQRAVLEAAADQIIPTGGGFPAPSEVEIVDFISRYVTPDGKQVKYFPLAGEFAFKDRLNALGQEFIDAPPSEQVGCLHALERGDEDQAAFFEQLRALVYYGYYARPEVTAAIRKNLPAGRDYHGPPQPYGYASVIEPWPEGILPHGRGAYLATADVQRVQIPDDLASEYGARS